MNNWNGIGRLTKDPELKFTPGKGTANTTFTIAIDDGYGDNKKTYYIPIVVWGKAAESTANYITKGSLVGITGKIATRNYDNKDGKKVYITEVIANQFDGVKFLDSKASNSSGNGPNNNQYSAQSNNNSFSQGSFEDEITPVDDGDMPF
jgi:single-strand DNA-binding protein